MEQLWAPWRMELISRGEEPKGCLFCELPRKTNDRENLVLGRTQRTFAMLNKYPYNNGHLMVIPRMHASDVHERIAVQGGNDIVTGTPGEFAALIRADLERYARLIREAKISAQ